MPAPQTSPALFGSAESREQSVNTVPGYWDAQRLAFDRLQPNRSGMSDDEALAWSNVISEASPAERDLLDELACRRLREIKGGWQI